MNNSRLDKDLKKAFLNKERLMAPLSEKEKEMADSIDIDVERIIKSRKNVIAFPSIQKIFSAENVSFKSLGSMAASLIVGIFVGSQFLGSNVNFLNSTQDNEVALTQQNEIRTKNFTALSTDSSGNLSDLIQEMNPGESLFIDLDENFKITFSIEDTIIINTDNCYILSILLESSSSSTKNNLKACKEMTFSGQSWVLSDIQN
tara:strand:+ start:916 stop:1524 length:609 start_codon:yes stop_codon:yes gene_type:complete